MNVRKEALRLLAGAFLAVTCDLSIVAQDVAQQPPSDEGMIVRQVPSSDSQTTQWSGIVARVRPSVVVIETDEGLASGFIIKADGVIVTNYHVVANAKEMAVRLQSGEVYRNVYLLGSDPDTDLAFIKIEAVDLPTIPLGNSNNVEVGEDVLLVGAPKGLEQTVSSGLISAIRIDEGRRVIQTSAAASPGSSGGPLLNRSGEAIGVMSFKEVNGENLNFTIPINYVRGKLDTLALSTTRAFETLKDQSEKRRGVWVTGYGSAQFPELYMALLDFLGTSGVEISNYGKQKFSDPTVTGFVPLPTLLETLPKTGADSLLYVRVEQGAVMLGGYIRATVEMRCFDNTGHLLWDEKVKSGAVTGENTRMGSAGWKRKLTPHIGQPGLLLRQSEVVGAQQPKN